MDLTETTSLEEMRDRYGITDEYTAEDLLTGSMETNASSFLKGTSMEHYFMEKVKSLPFGTIIEKVDDYNDKCRYDHIVLTENNLLVSFEVRTLLKSSTTRSDICGTVKLDFRDKARRNNPALPSGRLWETTARSKSKEESLDFFAIGLVNFTGNHDDFAYLHRKRIPSYYNFGKEEKTFSREDREYIAENYYAKSMKCPLPIKAPFTSNLEEMLKYTYTNPATGDSFSLLPEDP